MPPHQMPVTIRNVPTQECMMQQCVPPPALLPLSSRGSTVPFSRGRVAAVSPVTVKGEAVVKTFSIVTDYDRLFPTLS